MVEIKGQEKIQIFEIYSPYRVFWEIENPLADLILQYYTIKFYRRKRKHHPGSYVFRKSDGLIKAVNSLTSEFKCYYVLTKMTENRFEDPNWQRTNDYEM